MKRLLLASALAAVTLAPIAANAVPTIRVDAQGSGAVQNIFAPASGGSVAFTAQPVTGGFAVQAPRAECRSSLQASLIPIRSP